jgi:hypothetical protein
LPRAPVGSPVNAYNEDNFVNQIPATVVDIDDEPGVAMVLLSAVAVSAGAIRLEANWDNLDDYGKVVYHIIKDTPNLSRWRRPYPPTQEHSHSLKEFLDINPQSNVK